MLYPEDVGLLDDWCVDYIASGAFSECKNLEYVALADGLLGIYDGAFDGIESDSLTVVCWSDTPPELICSESGNPFSFGVPEESLRLIAWGNEDEYAEAWALAFAGYTSEDDLLENISQMFETEFGRLPTEDEAKAEAERIIIAAKERVYAVLDTEREPEERPAGADKYTGSDKAK